MVLTVHKTCIKRMSNLKYLRYSLLSNTRKKQTQVVAIIIQKQGYLADVLLEI